MYNIAILGITGVVGQEILSLLVERNFPVNNLKLLSSSRSAGKEIIFKNKKFIVEELTEKSFKNIDIVFSSAGGEISKIYVPLAVKEGAIVIDNTSYFRSKEDVPLIIPEINKEEIFHHNGIIANPNCSTIIMLLALFSFA